MNKLKKFLKSDEVKAITEIVKIIAILIDIFK